MTSRPGSEQPETDPNANPASDTPTTPGGTAVERIIERFGGIRPMAHKLDTPVTTVQGWKKRGAIPLSRHADLRAAAAKYEIALDEADLEAATPAEDRHATEGKPTETDTVAATAPTAEPAPEPVVETAAEPQPAPPAIENPTDERTKPTYTPPPPVERRSGAGFATAVSLLALLVGAAALSEPWWSPRVPAWPKAQVATPAPQIDPALRTQVQQLSDRLATLEQRPAAAATGNGASSADVQALASRIDALEKRPTPTTAGNGVSSADVQELASRIDALEKRPAPAPAAPAVDPAAVKDLSDRIAALEGKIGPDPQLTQDVTSLKQQVSTLAQQASARQDAAASAQALVLAAGQLRGALAGSGPFQSELQAAKAVGGGDPQIAQALDAVAPYAAKGIPTQVQLADRLRHEGGDIVRAALRGEGGNWVQQVTGALSTLVTVRRQGGDVVGDTPEAIVARAQAAMDQGNLKGAVDEVSKLQDPAAQAAAGWLADAKARLAANTAGQQLTNRSITALAAASGGKVPQ
ncbi:MAG TPA: mitofilin family membrane protein [Azospirillum sp.]|nr:mitofilin family membrane protein [Azospirillum sp.]